MTTTKELLTFLESVTEMERDFTERCARLRMLGTAAADELRRALFEAQHVNLKVYTEPEAAEVLRMSLDTLARLRVSEDLPHFRAGTLIRYTNKHLIEITELLDARRQRQEKKGGRQR